MSESSKDTGYQYSKHLESIAAQDIEVLREKDANYGASWLEYGGLSAFFATVRKWDRIRVQLKRVKWDVFEAYLHDKRQEGFMDDVRDLRRYLLLWEARAIELGLVPEQQMYLHFGQDMFMADEGRLREAFRRLLELATPPGVTPENDVDAIMERIRAGT